MKEAIGNSFVFNFIMIFTAIFIALLVGSLAFTKGFKIRNRIIDIVESYGQYSQEAANEIDENLRAIGYQMVRGYRCSTHNGVSALSSKSNGDYPYCIYEYGESAKGRYYGVKVFVRFDLPIIGSLINIPLYGETRVIFEKDKVTG